MYSPDFRSALDFPALDLCFELSAPVVKHIVLRHSLFSSLKS